MQLVFLENNRPVTDSLTVATTFGKEHKHVMRDIREMECSHEFHQSNFGLVDYKDDGGRTYQKHIITEQGFAFLVMGYTGKEAARFKEMYISEFIKMRQQLADPFATLSPELRSIILVDSKVQQLEQRVEEIDSKVETQITLTQGEQRRIQKAVSAKVNELAEDNDRSPLYRELYREIKDRWAVPSYRDLLRKDILTVIKYIDAWMPRRVEV